MCGVFMSFAKEAKVYKRINFLVLSSCLVLLMVSCFSSSFILPYLLTFYVILFIDLFIYFTELVHSFPAIAEKRCHGGMHESKFL